MYVTGRKGLNKSKGEKKMKQETKLKGETKMKEKTTFKVQEGLAFISTAESKNVSALKEASEKYHVDIPDARIPPTA